MRISLFIAILLLAFSARADFEDSMGMDVVRKLYKTAIGDTQYKILKKIKQNYERNINIPPAELNKIPRTIHHIWLEKTPLPENTKYFISTCKKANPNFEFKLWTSDDLKAFPSVSIATNNVEKTKLFSYEILKTHGGIYLGPNVECIASFDKLLSRYSIFAGLASADFNYKFTGNVLGSSVNNPVLIKTIADIHNKKNIEYSNLLFTNMVEAFDTSKDVMLMPAGYFNPTYKSNIIFEPTQEKHLVPAPRPETLAVEYLYGKSLVNYRGFNYELVNENSTIKFLYWPYYGNNQANIIFSSLYDKNFPTELNYSEQSKIPLQFQILCFNKCDSFWSDNMDLVKTNKNFSFNLWSSADLENVVRLERELFEKVDGEKTKRLLLVLYILNKDGGVYLSNKLSPVNSLDELAYKYDFFGAIPELSSYHADILIHLDAIGSMPANIIIEDCLARLMSYDKITTRLIMKTLTQSAIDNYKKAGKMIIFPGSYFYGNAKSNNNFKFTNLK